MKAGITKDLPLPSEWTDIMADEHETERDCVFEPESELGEDGVTSNDKAVMEQMLEDSCVFYTENDHVAVGVNDNYLGGEGNSMVDGEGLNWSESSSVTCKKCNVPVRRDNRGHLCELHKAANEVDSTISTSRDDFSDGAHHATAHSPVADTDDHVIVTDGQNVFVIDGLDSGSGTAVNGCGVVSGENGSRNKNSFGSYSAVENSVPSIHHDHARLGNVFDSASFAANGSCQSPSVSRQPFFNNGQQQFFQHHASMGLNLGPISPVFSMYDTGTVSPSAAFSPSPVTVPYPVLLQTAEGTMLYSGPVSYCANPFLPYPVPVGVGLGSAMSPLSGQLFSQATSPVGVAGQQPLGYPTQLLAPAIVCGQSSNPAVFPVGFHSQSPSQVVFPISFHGQSSDQHHQVLLPVSVNRQSSDEPFMLGSVHEQTVQLDASVNILQKPKFRRWKLIRDAENGRTHPRKPKCSHKQSADIQNTSAQAQGEGETFRAQAEADEMIGGVSGPKKPRKRGGRPKSAASKSGKGSSVSSSGIVSVSSGQKSTGKRTPKTDATAKTGEEGGKEEEPQKPITDFFLVRRSDRKRITSRELKKVREKEMQEKIQAGCQDGLEVVAIEGKGRGVIATKEFEKDDFVVEYAGELVNITTAKQREQLYEKDERVGCYMYYFNHKNKQYCIDATEETEKLGRLLNHSRKGNCYTKVVAIGDTPFLVLLASQHINKGEELTYDYGDRSQGALESHPWLKL